MNRRKFFSLLFGAATVGAVAPKEFTEIKVYPKRDYPYSFTLFADRFIADDESIDSRDGVELVMLDGEEPGPKLRKLIAEHGEICGIRYAKSRSEIAEVQKWPVPVN
jgi:hypothetical protein